MSGRNLTTMALLAATVLLALALLVWQSGWLDDDAPRAQLAETATLEPTGTALPPTPPPFTGVCEVTPMAADAPAGLLLTDPSFPAWYTDTDEAVWAAPLNLSALNPTLPEVEQRWFAGGVTPVNWFGPSEPVTVHAVKLEDGDSFTVDERSTSFPEQRTQSTELTFPEPGCWQLTGRAGDDELTITIAVAMLEARPDFVFARTGHAAAPSDVPADCQATAWVGPADIDNRMLAMYWLHGGWVALGHQTAVLVAKAETSLLLDADGDADAVMLTASMIEDSSVTMVAEVGDPRRGVRAAAITFPEPGCWRLDLTAAEETFNAVVYVYPGL